jgi:hypothetical protein
MNKLKLLLLPVLVTVFICCKSVHTVKLTNDILNNKLESIIPPTGEYSVCPVVGSTNTYNAETNFDEVVNSKYIHCHKCQIGVLFKVEGCHNGECSYCKELYENVF